MFSFTQLALSKMKGAIYSCHRTANRMPSPKPGAKTRYISRPEVLSTASLFHCITLFPPLRIFFGTVFPPHSSIPSAEFCANVDKCLAKGRSPCQTNCLPNFPHRTARAKVLAARQGIGRTKGGLRLDHARLDSFAWVPMEVAALFHAGWGVGEAKSEARRCGALRLGIGFGDRIYCSCWRWVNRWISPQGLR